jgi:xylulokinase
MSPQPYFLGIDVSTTACKALLVDGQGAVIGTASTSQPVSTPHPLWSEQDPHLWWQGTGRSIREVLQKTGISGDQIAAVGLTGQMHGLVLLDQRGEVLRPAILWNDQRTAPQCDEIRSRLGFERLVQVTGNDALTGFTAPKVLWVAENEPELYQRARHILLPKDYVRFRLTGEFAMDKADGSGTILFDLKQRDWSPEVLLALGIPAEWLPPTFEGPEITGVVSAAAASETGLKAGTPVIAGGGDQAAGAVGVGAVEPGIVSLVLGTSGVVFAAADAPLIEPQGRLHAFCHALPGVWHLMGVMLSAAGSLQWYHDTIAASISFDELVGEARRVPPGSDGLLFLPYLNGERTPHPDPLARSAWIGLTTRHSRAHLTRAVLEGVAFGLKDSFELLRQSGLADITDVRVSGGGAKSGLWASILASVLEMELTQVNTTEGAAYGAALLAGVGAAHWQDVPAVCRETIHITMRTEPEREGVNTYSQLYPIYRSLYPLLKDTSARLSNIG